MNLLELMLDNEGQNGRAGRIYGVVVGLVTNNEDPEQMGRVKVRFPWLTETDESHWARVSSLMGGPDRGTYFLPEVDDEVLVAFEHGDVRFPYVLGTLWNGQDAPPRDNSDGNNNVRVIRSRSGHELIFDDNSTEMKERIELHTNAGHEIILDDAAGQEKITIKDKTGSNSVEIDSVQNSISISAQLKISLSAPTIEIKADTMATLDGGAMLTVKGGLVKIN